MDNSLLSGYQVLDITGEKGWFCSKLLSNMGAKVVRLDRPGSHLSGSYSNSGKLSVSLDIESNKGKELFQRLIERSDVLVESYQPGYMQSLGLDYSSLSAINPRLIMASITDFGQTGPYRFYKASDLVACAMGGQMSVCGAPDTPPLKPYGFQAFYAACIWAANGIMMALWHRHASGKGQYIDTSIQECVAATLDHVLVRYFYEGTVARRQGNLYWNNLFRVFPCRDGYILLTLFHQWDTLVELLKAEGMAGDLAEKKWQDINYFCHNTDHVSGILEEWARSHKVSELVELGQLMHFPWAEVATIARLVANPQLNKRGYFVRDIEGHSYPGAACKMNQSPWRVSTEMPSEVGVHNMPVFHDELGLSDQAIEALRQEGVI